MKHEKSVLQGSSAAEGSGDGHKTSESEAEGNGTTTDAEGHAMGAQVGGVKPAAAAQERRASYVSADYADDFIYGGCDDDKSRKTYDA